MPNGRPGDHPVTDIVHHRLPVFTPEADELIRQIVAMGGQAELEREINLGGYTLSDADVARLRALHDRLRHAGGTGEA